MPSTCRDDAPRHLRIATLRIFCCTTTRVTLQTPTPPSTTAWEKSVAAFRRDREALKQLVADPDVDLFAKIPHGTGQTYLREALLVADHNAYHLGQLVTVRRLLDTWPVG